VAKTLGDVTIRDTPTARAASILIVEGDRDTLAGWVRLLHAAGYRVTGAASFEDARRAVQAAPDLLITEVRLGAYNGLQLIIRARAHNPHLPAIVLTAFSDVVIKAEAERLGAIYVEKPVDANRLLAIVADALERPRNV
jgi:DNA-binding NtrC family response regulator